MAGLALVGMGAFSIAGAAGDWDFFMEHRKARLVAAIVGRDGARVFYGLLGAGLAIGGIVAAVNGA